MTWTVKIKHTRPNTDVEFYKATENSYLSDVKSTYRDAEKLVSTSDSLSDNQLELTKTLVFDNEDSKDAFNDDSRIQAWISARNSHNTSNNITRVILQNEET